MKLWPFSKKDKPASDGKFELPPGVMLADPGESPLAPETFPQRMQSLEMTPPHDEQPAPSMPASVETQAAPTPQSAASSPLPFPENTLSATPPFQAQDAPFTLTADMIAPDNSAQPAGMMFETPGGNIPVAGPAGGAALHEKSNLDQFFAQNNLSLISPSEPPSAQETSDLLDFLSPPASPHIAMPGLSDEKPVQTSSFPPLQAQPANNYQQSTPQPLPESAPEALTPLATPAWQPASDAMINPEHTPDFQTPWQAAPEGLMPPNTPEPMVFPEPVSAAQPTPHYETLLVPPTAESNPSSMSDLLNQADVFEFAPPPQPHQNQSMPEPIAPPAASTPEPPAWEAPQPAPEAVTEWFMPDLSGAEAAADDHFFLPSQSENPTEGAMALFGEEAFPGGLEQALTPDLHNQEPLNSFYGLEGADAAEGDNGFYSLGGIEPVTSQDMDSHNDSRPATDAETLFSLDFPGDDAPSANVLDFGGTAEPAQSPDAISLTPPAQDDWLEGTPEAEVTAEFMTAHDDAKAADTAFDFDNPDESGVPSFGIPDNSFEETEWPEEESEAGTAPNFLNHEDYDLNHYPDPDEAPICLDLDTEPAAPPEPMSMPGYHDTAAEGGFAARGRTEALYTMDTTQEELAPFMLAEDFRADSSYYVPEESELPVSAMPEAEPIFDYQEPAPIEAPRPSKSEHPKQFAQPTQAQKPARTKSTFTRERQEAPPQYNRSMADALDVFGQETLLNESRFLRKSINDLVDRYFSQHGEEPAP